MCYLDKGDDEESSDASYLDSEMDDSDDSSNDDSDDSEDQAPTNKTAAEAAANGVHSIRVA